MASRRDSKRLPSDKSPDVDRGGAGSNVVKTPDRLALDDAFLNHESLRRGLRENLNARRIDNAKVSDRVEEAFSKVSLTMPAENDRSRLNHVAPGASTFDAVSAVVRRRVEAIQTSDIAPVVSVRERSKLVTWHKTRKPNDNAADAASGSLELEQFLKFVSVGQSGPLFASAPAEAARYEAEEQAQEVLDNAVSNGKGKPQLKQDSAPAVDLGADTLVVEKVNVQMRSVTAPEDKLTYGLIPNSAGDNETQKKLLETFELRPGASDVTAYHDFHTLRIAFEHVWTRLFDGDLEKLGRELYKEYVGLKDFLGYDPNTDRPITSLDDLTWLINEIRTLSNFAQEAIPPQLTNGQDAGDAAGAGTAKGASDVTADVARVTAAVLTGGLSALAETAINEISKLFSRPIKHWDDLNGQRLDHGDKITATFEYNVGNAGSIELALRSDVGTHWKGFILQIWNEKASQFANHAAVTNGNLKKRRVNGQQYYWDSISIQSSLVPTGVIEFSSEQSPTFNLPRYILINLAEGDKLRDGMRITFYWQDK